MKLKSLYAISFWFGLIYLALKLLSIPGTFMLLRAQGISFDQLTYVISTNSIFANLAFFGSMINGIIIGVLIATISFLLIRNKIRGNRIMNAGITMISISALLMTMLFIINIVLMISTSSIQTLFSIGEHFSKIIYQGFPIFFFVAIILFVAGYIKEMLKTLPVKDFRIFLPSLALLIIIVVDLIKIFN